jgi:hypothetical protein
MDSCDWQDLTDVFHVVTCLEIYDALEPANRLGVERTPIPNRKRKIRGLQPPANNAARPTYGGGKDCPDSQTDSGDLFSADRSRQWVDFSGKLASMIIEN